MFKNIIKRGYQIRNKVHPFISATSDAFTIEGNIPVEIKTSKNDNIESVIRLHYHQLQYCIFCSGCDYMIVIFYILGKSFRVLKLAIDTTFIMNYLPPLEFAFYRYHFNEDEWIDIDGLEKLLNTHKVFKHISNIRAAPQVNRVRKTIIYDDMTAFIFIG